MRSLGVFAKTVMFTVLVPGTVAVLIPWYLRRYRPHPRLPVGNRTGRTLGCAAILSGALVYAHTAWRFTTEGGGTPSPTDEPAELVTGGLYAHVRNPMYAGVLLVISGQALWYRSVSVLWWAVGCWIGFHNRIIAFEEPHLTAKHGEAYDTYRETVPRWIPAVNRRRDE